MELFATLVGSIITIGISCAVTYFVVKAAMSAALRDFLWHMEISTRNAVKNGTLEALKELEAAEDARLRLAIKAGVQEAMIELEKARTEEKNG